MVSIGTFSSYIFAFLGLIEGLIDGKGCSKDSSSEVTIKRRLYITYIKGKKANVSLYI